MLNIIVGLVLFICFMYLFLKNDSQFEEIQKLTTAKNNNLTIIKDLMKNTELLLSKLQKYQHRNDDLIKENTEIVKENKEMYIEINKLKEEHKNSLKYIWFFKRKNLVKRKILRELTKQWLVTKEFILQRSTEIYEELKKNK